MKSLHIFRLHRPVLIVSRSISTFSHTTIYKPRPNTTFNRPNLYSINILTKRWSSNGEWHASQMSMEDYHQVADQTMDRFTEYFEALGDELDIDGWDVEYSQGVLTVKFGPQGTYVINKQPPNKQIWLSSPTSGPKRFDWDEKMEKWVYYRDGTTLDGLLNQELTEMLEREIVLDP